MTAAARSNEISPDSQVSFSVKELLSEQTDLLRGIDKKVDGKADKADLVPLLTRLDDHQARLVTMEDGQKAEAAVAAARRSFRTKAWAVTASVFVPLAVALLLVLVH